MLTELCVSSYVSPITFNLRNKPRSDFACRHRVAGVSPSRGWVSVEGPCLVRCLWARWMGLGTRSHRPHRASRPRDVLTGPCSPPTPGGFSHLIDGPNRTEVQRHLVAGLCPAAPELPCGEPAAQQSHLEGWAVRVAGPHNGSTQTVPRPQGASSRQGRLTHVLKVTRDTGWGVGSCVSPSCPAVARWAPSCLPTSSSHPPHPCP